MPRTISFTPLYEANLQRAAFECPACSTLPRELRVKAHALCHPARPERQFGCVYCASTHDVELVPIYEASPDELGRVPYEYRCWKCRTGILRPRPDDD